VKLRPTIHESDDPIQLRFATSLVRCAVLLTSSHVFPNRAGSALSIVLERETREAKCDLKRNNSGDSAPSNTSQQRIASVSNTTG
jgi:hypothetical protein